MYNEDNVFYKIIQGNLVSEKCYEDEQFLVIYDKYPRYQYHFLLIPKQKFVSFDDFIKNSSVTYVGEYFKIIEKIVTKYGIDKSGYRIVSNHHNSMGQEIFHFHTHIMGGDKLNKD